MDGTSQVWTSSDEAPDMGMSSLGAAYSEVARRRLRDKLLEALARLFVFSFF